MYSYLNKKQLATIMMMLLAILLTSCLKNRNGETNLSTVPRPGEVAELPDPGFHSEAFDFTTQPQTVPVYVNIASPAPVAQDVVVTLALDPTGLADYNSANGSSYEVPDATVFSIASLKVTIKAGQNLGSLPIVIHPDKVDLSKQLAIPLKIADASGRTISQNLQTVIYAITVKNKYEGTYASSGSRYNFNSTADAPNNPASVATWSFDTYMSTVDANTCAVQAGNLNGGFVTIAATANTGLNALVPTPGKTSTYDPSTKTFHLYYQYTNTNGTFRLLDHVLVAK
jgi:hypothetical protein